MLVQSSLLVLFFARLVDLCLPSKCSSTTCYVMPPSPPMYPSPPMMSPPMPPMYVMAPPPPPPPPAPIPPHSSMMMMTAAVTPFIAPLDPPLPQISSSALNSYEVAPHSETTRWDRQEPEYKHIEEQEVVAPDVVIADAVDENSTNSEMVEKVHENERLARMDLKFEEPEPTPFDNGTVTFHAWFFT